MYIQHAINSASLSIADIFAGQEDTPGKHLQCSNGGAIVNGVYLPPLVAKQLLELGMPLSSYSPGQLQEAILASFVDCRLVDDVRGDNFSDMLSLMPDETVEQTYVPGMMEIPESSLFRSIKAQGPEEESLYSQLTESKDQAERASTP